MGYIWSLWFLHVDTGYSHQTLDVALSFQVLVNRLHTMAMEGQPSD